MPWVKLAAGLAVLAVAVLALRSSTQVVMAHEKRALEVRGEFRGMLDPGLNFVTPFVSETYSIDRRTVTLRPDPPEGLTTRDGTAVSVDVVAEYRVDDARAAYERLGPHPHRAVADAAAGALRGAVGRQDASSLREDPASVGEAVESAIEDLRRSGVDLDEVAVEGVEVHDARSAERD